MSVYAQSATLVATYQGKEIGTASYKVGVSPSGEVSKAMSVKMNAGGSVIESKTSADFSWRGECLTKLEYTAIDGKPRTNLTIRFSSKSATVIDNVTGKKQTFATPADPPARETNELWFVKTRPKVGDKVVASVLSTQKGWQSSTVTYTGDKSVTVGGKTIRGHVIHHVDSAGTYDRVVDDHGIPLMFGLPNIPGLDFTRK